MELQIFPISISHSKKPNVHSRSLHLKSFPSSPFNKWSNYYETRTDSEKMYILSDKLPLQPFPFTRDLSDLKSWSLEILQFLLFLNDYGVDVHGQVSLNSIGLLPNNHESECSVHGKNTNPSNTNPSNRRNINTKRHDQVGFNNWGLYYILGKSDVTFPLGYAEYLAPECILHNHYSHKSDIFALGILLFNLYFNILTQINFKNLKSTFEYTINQEHIKRIQLESNMDKDLQDFLLKCLNFDMNSRSCGEELLQHVFLNEIQSNSCHIPSKWIDTIPSTMQELQDLQLTRKEWVQLWIHSPLVDMSKYSFNISTTPSILKIPSSVRLGQEIKDIHSSKHSCESLSISLEDFIIQTCRPLQTSTNTNQTTTQVNLEKRFHDSWKNISNYWTSESISSTLVSINKRNNKINLVIKARDPSYQYQRIQLMKPLLLKYPKTSLKIHSQAVIDIPTILRGSIWSCLLGIKGEPDIVYEVYNKGLETSMDRQIELDLPRCHSYHPYISSKQGQSIMKRILKAWVISETDCHVYWQGLDSILAPFVSIYHQDEARALVCLKEFLNKFCISFFLVDNSAVIERYMNLFKRLILFHDPELANYMHEIHFEVKLFAIPWFMTAFAHVFSIDKLYFIWDVFLVNSRIFPLYFALGILSQLRRNILNSDFNQNMLLITQLSRLDIEECLTNAILFCKSTPPSLIHSLELVDFNSVYDSLPVGSISFEDFIEISIVSWMIDTRSTFTTGHVRGSYSCTKPEHVNEFIQKRMQTSTKIKEFVVVLYDDMPIQILNALIANSIPRLCLSMMFQDNCTCGGYPMCLKKVKR